MQNDQKSGGQRGSAEFNAFADTLRKLVQVPKTELDERLRQYETQKPHKPGPKKGTPNVL